MISSSARRRSSSLDDQPTIPFPGLFDVDDSDARLTLAGFYQKNLLPGLKHRSKDHREKFAVVLGAWERIMGHLSLGELDGRDDLLERFRTELLQPPGGRKPLKSPAVNTYVGYVLRILRVAGPRDAHNPEGKGVIAVPPWVRRLSVRRSMPRALSRSDLSRFYEACSIATWPANRNLPAPLWWRVLICLAYTYGPRTEDLAPIKRKKMGLAASTIVRSAECPLPGYDLTNPDGWLVFCPEKTKNEKPELVLPLTSVVRRHLDALPPSRCESSLLLPCTTHYDDPKLQRKAIEKAAGIASSVTIQALRRSSTTYWRPLDADVALYVTGHAPRGVNARSYLDVLQAMLDGPIGRRMIDRFQYPDAMAGGP